MLSSSISPQGKSRWSALLAGMICGFAFVSNAHAADSASGVISSTSLGGGNFDYTIKLTDTGSGNLETFWFSWIPGQDFMPVSPTNIVSPTDWTANITGGGGSDGFAIQWLTSGSSTPAPLTPGATDTFTFESTATPSQLLADSSFHPASPVLTAFVYSGAPFSDAGEQFQVVPEPSTNALFLLGCLATGFVVWRRRVLTAAPVR
jgi:hypothetical protein